MKTHLASIAAALLLLAGQAAPALHLALDSHHHHHECCTHEDAPAHWCACQDPDHHEPCAGCDDFTLAAADLPAAAGVDTRSAAPRGLQPPHRRPGGPRLSLRFARGPPAL